MNNKVCGIVARIMGVPAETVTEDSSPDSLPRWDSLRHMKLVLAIEEAFGMQFTDEEIVSIKGVRSIIVLLGQRTGG